MTTRKQNRQPRLFGCPGARKAGPLIRRTRSDDPKRRAAAIVEFAVVLPLLLTVLFGIIEYGWMFMVRQGVMNAAREGCRVAVLSTTTEPYTEVTERVMESLAPMGITPIISMTHATPEDPVETVIVRVPAANVSLLGNFFGARDFDIVGSCTMRKEGI